MDRDEVIALARKFDMRKGRRPRTQLPPTPVFATKKDVEAAARLYDERLARASAYARARRRSGRGRQDGEWSHEHLLTDAVHDPHEQDDAIAHSQPVNHHQALMPIQHHSEQFVPHHSDAHGIPYHQQAHMQSVHSQALGTHAVPAHPHQALAHSQQLVVHGPQALALAQPPHIHAQDMTPLPQQHLAPMQHVDSHSHLAQNNSQEVELHSQSPHAHGQHASIHRQGIVAHADEANGFVQVDVGHTRVTSQAVEDMENQATHVVENIQHTNSLAHVPDERGVSSTVDGIAEEVGAHQHSDRYQQQAVTHHEQVEGYQQQGDAYRESDEAYQQQAETYPQEGDTFQQQGEPFQQVVETYPQENEAYHQEGETEQQQVERYQQEVEALQHVVKDQQDIGSHRQEDVTQQQESNGFVQSVGTHHAVDESQEQDVTYHLDVDNLAVEGAVIQTHCQSVVVHQNGSENREHDELHPQATEKDTQILVSEDIGADTHHEKAENEQAEVDAAGAPQIEINGQQVAGVHSEEATGSEEIVIKEQQIEPSTDWHKVKGPSISTASLTEEFELTVKAGQIIPDENQTRSALKLSSVAVESTEPASTANVANGQVADEIAGEVSPDADGACAYDSDAAVVNGDRVESADTLCAEGNRLNCAEDETDNTDKLVFEGGTCIDGGSGTMGVSKRCFDEVVGIEDARNADGSARKKAKCSDVAVNIE